MVFSILHVLISVINVIFIMIIIPTMFNDIKDQIKMQFYGNDNLWLIFYHQTLTKSVVKLDFVMNCQFWSSLIFICITFTDAFILALLPIFTSHTCGTDSPPGVYR